MILDRFSLAGKVAIVTGAGRGIGRGIALKFAEAGADVVCVARTASEIESAAESVRALGRRALAIPGDVVDGEQVQAFVDRAMKEFGHIDILVNNAGGSTSFGPLMKTSERAFLAVLRLNLIAPFLCSKAVAKVMLEQRSGSIINISSGDSLIPCTGLAPYGAAKAGLNSLTRTMAWELAPYVRVNVILPGAIWTEGSSPFLGTVKDEILAGTPMKRFGKPEDIAMAALYLASSASEWVTGKLFQIDGGIEFVHVDPSDLMKQYKTEGGK